MRFFGHRVFEIEIWNINGQKLLLKLYNLLASLQSIKDPTRAIREVDSGIDIPEPIWEQLFFFNYDFSLNVDVKEHCYSLLHRWYLTPLQLSQNLS